MKSEVRAAVIVEKDLGQVGEGCATITNRIHWGGREASEELDTANRISLLLIMIIVIIVIIVRIGMRMRRKSRKSNCEDVICKWFKFFVSEDRKYKIGPNLKAGKSNRRCCRCCRCGVVYADRRRSGC